MDSSAAHDAYHMQVKGYSDISKLEKEIGRLLQCENGRGAACLETLPYMKFR